MDVEHEKRPPGVLNGRYAAFLLVIGADFTFCLIDTTAQNLTQHGVSPFQIVFMRMTLTSIGVLLYLLFGPPRLPPQDIAHQLSPWTSQGRLIWLRGVNMAVGVTSCYFALSQIDVSAFITIFHLRPFPTAFLCFVVLGEPFGRVQTISCVISLVGLALVMHTGRSDPSSAIAGEVAGQLTPRDWIEDKPHPEHVAFAYGCSVFTMLSSALEYLNTRMIDPSTSPLILLLAYCLSAVILSPIAMWSFGISVVLSIPIMGYIKICILAVLGMTAQILLVMALQREKGGRVAVISYLQIPMAVLVQEIFVGTLPGPTRIVGMAIIITAGVWAMLDSLNKSKAESEQVGLAERGSYARVAADESA